MQIKLQDYMATCSNLALSYSVRDAAGHSVLCRYLHLIAELVVVVFRWLGTRGRVARQGLYVVQLVHGTAGKYCKLAYGLSDPRTEVAVAVTPTSEAA